MITAAAEFTVSSIDPSRLEKPAPNRRRTPPKESLEEQEARILRRIEVGKRLRKVQAKAMRMQAIHSELIDIQAKHKTGLQIPDKKLRREKLRPIEATWLELATEWAGLLTEVRNGDRECRWELVQTCPLGLLTDRNDALELLNVLTGEMEQRTAEAIAGIFPLEKLKRLQERVDQQNELYKELNRRVEDPTVLV